MVKQRKRTAFTTVWLLSAAVAVAFVGAGIFLVKMLSTDNGQKRRRQVQAVTVIKPPPPPKIKEKPPEPEVKKEEEIIEPEVEKEELPEQMEEQAESDAPAGDDLGLDADGVGGSDAFGLVGKKGGRALIGGGGTSQYAWYTRIVRHELEKSVNKLLQENGGVPDGKLEAVVKIVLDDQGAIVQHAIISSSGDQRVDDAINKALSFGGTSEPPPEGMPKKMLFRISC